MKLMITGLTNTAHGFLRVLTGYNITLARKAFLANSAQFKTFQPLNIF